MKRLIRTSAAIGVGALVVVWAVAVIGVPLLPQRSASELSRPGSARAPVRSSHGNSGLIT